MTAVIATPTINENDTLVFEGTNQTIELPALTQEEIEAGVAYNETLLNGEKTTTRLARALTRFAAAGAELDNLADCHKIAKEGYELARADSGEDFDSPYYNAFFEVSRDIKGKMKSYQNVLNAQASAVIKELKGDRRLMNPEAVAKLIEAQFKAGV